MRGRVGGALSELQSTTEALRRRCVVVLAVAAALFIVLAPPVRADPSWSAPISLDHNGPFALTGVACPSASQCTAIDRAGHEVTFDPTSSGTATPTTISSSHGLTALACPSASQCTAVDDAVEEVTFDPTSPGTPTPTTIDSGAFGPLTAVACPSTSQCTAVDDSGQEVTFDPTSPDAPTPTLIGGPSELTAVACPIASQCTAVDDAGREVTFDPTSPGTPTPATIDSGFGGLFAIACPSASQCTAVDQDGHEVTFDPTSPGTPSTAPIDGGQALHGVACPSASQCTAVDDAGQEVTFDPTSPGTPTPTATGGRGLTGIACPSASQCTAVDGAGQEVTFDPTSPGTPTPSTIAPGEEFQLLGAVIGIACPSLIQCIAVGSDSFAGQEVTFDPTSPGAPTPSTIDQGAPLLSVACASVALCVAVDGDQEGPTSLQGVSPGNAFVGQESAVTPPGNTAPPTISGSAVQGQTLAEAQGSWTNSPTVFAYQWEDCDSSGNSCSAIPGATSQTYTLVAGDVGHTIRVQEAASNAGGSGTPASSAASGVVAPAPATRGTLTQGTPLSATATNGLGYSGQLTVTNPNGAVSYTEDASIYSSDVVVSATGAVTYAGLTLPPGVYSVRGADSDAAGDTGTWTFGLTVRATTYSRCALPSLTVPNGYYVSAISLALACPSRSVTWTFTPIPPSGPYSECAQPNLTVPPHYYVSVISLTPACHTTGVSNSATWTLTPIPSSGPYNECAQPNLTVPHGYYVSAISLTSACSSLGVSRSVTWSLRPIPSSGPYSECAQPNLTVPHGYYVSAISLTPACYTLGVSRSFTWTLTPIPPSGPYTECFHPGYVIPAGHLVTAELTVAKCGIVFANVGYNAVRIGVWPGGNNPTLATKSMTASATGGLAATVTCPPSATTCTGTMALLSPGAVPAVASAYPARKANSPRVTLAVESFAIPGGDAAVVKLRLTAKARKLLARRHLIHAQAMLVVHKLSGAHTAATSTKYETVTIHQGGPSAALLTAGLRPDIRPSGPSARIGALLRAHGYVVSLSALSLGKLTIDWHYLPKRTHRSGAPAESKPLLVARGQAKVSARGAVTMKLKLTPSGKRLLQHVTKLKVTARAIFTPIGQQAVVAEKKFTLTRER